jgi:hypothetical protein
MNHNRARTSTGMRLIHLLAAATLVFGVAALGSGCGDEAKQSSGIAAPPNVPPGGGDPKQYMQEMNRIKGGQGGASGGGGGMPHGGPGGK